MTERPYRVRQGSSCSRGPQWVRTVLRNYNSPELRGKRIGPSHKESPHADRTASLVWGAENGLLRVDLWTRNKGNTRHPFPRTLEGLAEALAFAQTHLSGE